MPGWLFSPPTPMGVRKITSPPGGVKRRRTRKKNGGGCVFAFQGLALGAQRCRTQAKQEHLIGFKVFYI